MKMMAFGELRFDRESIPAELRDVASWPGADDGALSREARDVLQRRIQAMALFVDGHASLREIGRVTGLRFNDTCTGCSSGASRCTRTVGSSACVR
jgi:prepilin-type processing-associated H-X9-DG protein